MKRIKLTTEFDYFLDLIDNNRKFALSRFGDGEMTIIQNRLIDLRSKGRYCFDPKIESHRKFSALLKESIDDDFC